MPGKTLEGPSRRPREEGGKTVRIVARTHPSKRERFYRIARELRLDAPNLVNGLVDALIEAYEARGEVAFPLRIELRPAGGRRSGRPRGHARGGPGGGGLPEESEIG